MLPQCLSALVLVFSFAIPLPASLSADEALQRPKPGSPKKKSPNFYEVKGKLLFQLEHDAFQEVLRPVREARERQAAMLRNQRQAKARLWPRPAQYTFRKLTESLNSEDIFVDARVYDNSDGQVAWMSLAKEKAQTYVPLQLRFVLVFQVAEGKTIASPGLVAFRSGLDCHLHKTAEATACLELWCKRWLEQRLEEASLEINDQQKIEAIAHIAASKISRKIADAGERCLSAEDPIPFNDIQPMLDELTASLDSEDSLLRKYLNSEIAKQRAATAQE